MKREPKTKCTKCFDTGLVIGPRFDIDNPTTYEDFIYCTCELGVATQKSDQELVDDR